MKKTVLFLLLVGSFATGHAQPKSGDAQLDARLQQYLRWNRELNFEKVMDYVHPVLFTVAPRSAIVESFRAVFASDEMTVKIDSTNVSSIGKAYRHDTTNYVKINYYSVISLAFNDTSVYSMPGFEAQMIDGLQKGFAAKKVTFDRASRKFFVKGTDTMFAIRDGKQPWLFLGYQENQPELVKKVFPKEVIAYYKLL